LGDDVNSVEVGALVTVCISVADVLFAKFPSLLYSAVRLWLPTLRFDLVHIALPKPSNCTEPHSVVVPSLNATVPVGVPPAEVTVAVNVTVSPYVEGFGDDVSVVVVVALTVCDTGAEVLERKLESPPYVAVRLLWMPMLRVDIGNVATPAFRGLVPNEVPLS